MFIHLTLVNYNPLLLKGQYFGFSINQKPLKHRNMKKVTSILAVALMALGMATFVIENSASEFDFINDITKALACDDCSIPPPPPRGGGPIGIVA